MNNSVADGRFQMCSGKEVDRISNAKTLIVLLYGFVAIMLFRRIQASTRHTVGVPLIAAKKRSLK
jgi:hypothetical protein